MMKLLVAFALLLPLAWLLPSDVVEHRYATRAELRTNGHGWLPDILPGSARAIRTRNDLDLNLSSGEFGFIDTDAGAFFARLEPGAPDVAPYARWHDIVEDYRAGGYLAWRYREGDEHWVFFCHPRKDRCEYVSW